jgi:hypothetical protein
MTLKMQTLAGYKPYSGPNRHVIRVMGKPFVIPAVHRNLHSENFHVRKISGGKKF